MTMAPDSCQMTANFWQGRLSIADKMLKVDNYKDFEDEVYYFVDVIPNAMPSNGLCLATVGLSISRAKQGQVDEAKAYFEQAKDAYGLIEDEDYARFQYGKHDLEALLSIAKSLLSDNSIKLMPVETASSANVLVCTQPSADAPAPEISDEDLEDSDGELASDNRARHTRADRDEVAQMIDDFLDDEMDTTGSDISASDAGSQHMTMLDESKKPEEAPRSPVFKDKSPPTPTTSRKSDAFMLPTPSHSRKKLSMGPTGEAMPVEFHQYDSEEEQLERQNKRRHKTHARARSTSLTRMLKDM